MKGWSTPITPEGLERDGEVIAVLCDASFPEPEYIRDAVLRYPGDDAVWVVRERDRLARAALENAGLDYVVASLNPYWKSSGRDLRNEWREQEMLNYSTMILDFKDGRKSLPELTWWELKIRKIRNHYTITRGEKKRRRRKGKDPHA